MCLPSYSNHCKLESQRRRGKGEKRKEKEVLAKNRFLNKRNNGREGALVQSSRLYSQFSFVKPGLVRGTPFAGRSRGVLGPQRGFPIRRGIRA